jgi:hypothetical protein
MQRKNQLAGFCCFVSRVRDTQDQRINNLTISNMSEGVVISDDSVMVCAAPGGAALGGRRRAIFRFEFGFLS